MKTLVTGAAGFIGSRLCAFLLEAGHEVVGIDSLNDYYSPQVKSARIEHIKCGPGASNFRFIAADLLHVDLSVLLHDRTAVFHLAGQPGVRASWGSEFNRYIENNVLLTQRLLEAARSVPSLNRFVYSSSSSVYGNALEYPTVETQTPTPISPYGVTKLAAEHLCNLYGANYGVPTTSLRYFTVYGPGQRPDMAFARFMRSALEGSPVSVFGDGKQVRDFTFVDDVVEANIKAATNDVPFGSVFNVAGGSSISVSEVIQLIGEMVGTPVQVHYGAAVKGDVHRTGGDITSIRNALGWGPRTALNEGLRRQFSWAQGMWPPA